MHVVLTRSEELSLEEQWCFAPPVPGFSHLSLKGAFSQRKSMINVTLGWLLPVYPYIDLDNPFLLILWTHSCTWKNAESWNLPIFACEMGSFCLQRRNPVFHLAKVMVPDLNKITLLIFLRRGRYFFWGGEVLPPVLLNTALLHMSFGRIAIPPSTGGTQFGLAVNKLLICSCKIISY